jgi:uncharacterized damage-inducible protein DinB
MPSNQKPEFPEPTEDERELLLRWLAFLRGGVLRNIEGLSDDQARWTPAGTLIPLIGVVNHLTQVEWRWIDGHMRGQETSRSEEEFRPAEELTVTEAVAAYQERARATEAAVRAMPSMTEPTREDDEWHADLRWVLLHVINETARHAGHADAVRELLDGTTGQ